MGLLPTAQRFACWRPDNYTSPLCPRCRSVNETSDHLFVCQVNVLTPPEFASRLREEVAAALPVALVPDGRSFVDALIASGLSLAGFRGTLSPDLSVLIRSVPTTLPLHTASLALLRAMLNVAYFDFWKPRCETTIELELRRGLTARQKRLLPNQRPQADRVVPLDQVPAVLNGHPHSSSPSFSSSQAVVMTLWSNARSRLLGNP